MVLGIWPPGEQRQDDIVEPRLVPELAENWTGLRVRQAAEQLHQFSVPGEVTILRGASQENASSLRAIEAGSVCPDGVIRPAEILVRQQCVVESGIFLRQFAVQLHHPKWPVAVAVKFPLRDFCIEIKEIR